MTVHEVRSHITRLAERVVCAAEAWDHETMEEASLELKAALLGPEELPFGVASCAMRALRSVRRFNLLGDLADALLERDPNDIRARCEYAQALIDAGRLGAAEGVLDASPNARANPSESPLDEEACRRLAGLRGRLAKQRYVNGAGAGNADPRFIRGALHSYAHGAGAAMRCDPWLRVNVLACAARAERDGVELPAELRVNTVRLAERLLERAKDRISAGREDAWDYAVGLEASLSVPTDSTMEWCERFISLGRPSPFACASLLRQLEEVWEIDRRGPIVPGLRATLRGAILESPGGAAVVAPETARQDALQLEQLFSATRPVPIKLYQRGLERARCVARVEDDGDRPHGTAFVLRGEDLYEGWKGRLVAVTNHHVVSNSWHALSPARARIVFHFPPDACGFTGRMLWSHEGLDVTVLRLSSGREHCPVARRLPALNESEDPHVYVVGHPLGGPLCLSIRDNRLLDYNDTQIHYRAPTTSGSSGSPVFNSQWEVIGLHFGGGRSVPRLDGKGRYPANCATSIHAIREAIGENPGCYSDHLASSPTQAQPVPR